MLTDHGISVERAAFASSLLGVALLIGRVFSGYFLDRFFGPYVAILLFSGVAVGISLLWAAQAGASRCWQPSSSVWGWARKQTSSRI